MPLVQPFPRLITCQGESDRVVWGRCRTRSLSARRAYRTGEGRHCPLSRLRNAWLPASWGGEVGRPWGWGPGGALRGVGVPARARSLDNPLGREASKPRP